jgi:hypothetical protein
MKMKKALYRRKNDLHFNNSKYTKEDGSSVRSWLKTLLQKELKVLDK